jgi:hypothetical protein
LEQRKGDPSAHEAERLYGKNGSGLIRLLKCALTGLICRISRHDPVN